MTDPLLSEAFGWLEEQVGRAMLSLEILDRYTEAARRGVTAAWSADLLPGKIPPGAAPCFPVRVQRAAWHPDLEGLTPGEIVGVLVAEQRRRVAEQVMREVYCGPPAPWIGRLRDARGALWTDGEAPRSRSTARA
jgi:hypothetical protein